jgi:hypothetical protein
LRVLESIPLRSTVTEMLRRCRRRWRSTVIPLNIRIGVYGRQSWSATILRLWRRVVTAILLRRRRLLVAAIRLRLLISVA